jgi:hypothetical protein
MNAKTGLLIVAGIGLLFVIGYFTRDDAVGGISSTETPTMSATSMPTATETSTPTLTATMTATATATATFTPTATQTVTPPPTKKSKDKDGGGVELCPDGSIRDPVLGCGGD